MLVAVVYTAINVSDFTRLDVPARTINKQE